MFKKIKNIILQTDRFLYKKFGSDKSTKFLENIKEARIIFSYLNEIGKESRIRFVGGCVRKAICGENIEDIDLATSLEPDDVKMKTNLNQKLINLIEYYNLINANFLLSNNPLKRKIDSTTHVFAGTKFEKLNKLKKKIQLIKNCKLKKNATNLVFGNGNINSKIMIVGEGPGANEDAEGKPFVGRAGKLLDKMLAAIQLDRTKVYITNVVNYRPPSNRRPTEVEIERYLPYLKSHIEIINPKILLLLGSTALNTLIGDDVVISKARGKWIQKEIGLVKPWIIASFHPAFLMRQPEQKKLAWIDLKMIRDKSKILKI